MLPQQKRFYYGSAFVYVRAYLLPNSLGDCLFGFYDRSTFED